jgi:chromosome segregation ATPase
LFVGVFIVWRTLSGIPKEDEVVLKKAYEEKQKALEQALRMQEMVKEDSKNLENKLVMAREVAELAKKESDQMMQQVKDANDKALECERQAAEALEKMKAFEMKVDEAAKKADGQMSGCAETIRVLQAEMDELKQKENSYQDQIKILEEKMAVAEEAAHQAKKRQDLDEVKKVSDQSSVQNKLVQIELVKARARAQGLEKICADYQSQLEEVSRKSQGLA